MKSRTKSRAVAIGGLILLLLATSTASARTLQVEFDAADFAPGVALDNQYWPLIAGTTQVRGSIEHKYYCPAGGGLMLIEELKGKTVRVEFVGTTRPPGTYASTGACEE